MGVVYFLSFLGGVFTLWWLGREEYYDEDRLIDLAIFPTGIALIVARLSFFLTESGRVEWQLVQSMPSLWMALVRVFQLNAGVVWWIGVLVFMVVALGLVWWWRWPLWPIIGFWLLAAGITISMSEILLLRWRGLLAGGVLLTAIMFYLIKLGGDEMVGDFWRGVGDGYRRQIAQLTHRSSDDVESPSGSDSQLQETAEVGQDSG